MRTDLLLALCNVLPYLSAVDASAKFQLAGQWSYGRARQYNIFSKDDNYIFDEEAAGAEGTLRRSGDWWQGDVKVGIIRFQAREDGTLVSQLRNINDGEWGSPIIAHRAKVPCPQYEPVRVSDWELQSGQLTLDVAFPKIEQRTLRTWLDADKSMIRIKGLRGISSRDRECLPEDASVSANGQREVLEVVVPVPKNGVMQKWSAQLLQGRIRLSMPLKVEPPDVKVEDIPYDWPEKESNAAEGYFDRDDYYEY